MAVIRDKMPAFQLFQPSSTEEALGVLDRYGAEAWVLAGGLDSWDWFKDRIQKPAAVVDLGGIASLHEIRATSGGVEIGAMATLREVIRHPDISGQFGILGQAASKAASPQIQNQGTLGGNVGQDTRCWYYRDGWSCYRAGGNICYADTPTAMNREHAILGASRCVAVNPSDTAPVLVALDAEMVVVNASGERVIPAQD
nr:FAD binding domain-containing protein [Acidimicrobiales bacterium]